MSLEKRGNSEIEITMKNGSLWMILPGSNTVLPYDGRCDSLRDGLIKKAQFQEGGSIFFEDMD